MGGEFAGVRQWTPPPISLFGAPKRETGCGRSKEKKRFAALRCSGPPRGRGSPEPVLTKTAGLLPARAGLLIYATPAPRVRCVSRRGGKSHGPCFCPRCRSMVPRRARQRLAERKARRSENVKCDLAPTASVSTQPRGLANKPEQTPPRPWGGHHKLEGTLSRPAPV